jgi:hypothetical protein
MKKLSLLKQKNYTEFFTEDKQYYFLMGATAGLMFILLFLAVYLMAVTLGRM